MPAIYEDSVSLRGRLRSAERFGKIEKLVICYQVSREETLRAHVVCRFNRLIYKIACRFAPFGVPLEDLVQEGRLGLLRAIDMYDETKGAPFSNYAARRVTSTIEHHIRDYARIIRQPAWIQERSYRIRRETERLRGQLGREPELSEVARSLELPEEEILEAIRLTELNDMESLDESFDEEGAVTRGECIASPLPGSGIGDRFDLRAAAMALAEPELAVIDLLFFKELSRRETAEILEIPLSRVRSLLQSAMTRLKREMVKGGFDPN